MQQMSIGREPSRNNALLVGLALCAAALAVYALAVVLLVRLSR